MWLWWSELELTRDFRWGNIEPTSSRKSNLYPRLDVILLQSWICVLFARLENPKVNQWTAQERKWGLLSHFKTCVFLLENFRLYHTIKKLNSARSRYYHCWAKARKTHILSLLFKPRIKGMLSSKRSQTFRSSFLRKRGKFRCQRPQAVEWEGYRRLKQKVKYPTL